MGYLRLEEIHSLQRMRFAPRNRIQGTYIGLHDSPQQGQNVEFREYREYNPGEDAGRIDWKVYGRSNRLVVKHYEHQTNLQATVIMDGSSSMAFRGWRPQRLGPIPRRLRGKPPPIPKPSKFDYACQLACAVSFLLLQQKDRVGFAMSRGGLESFLPCRGGMKHLHQLEHLMQSPPLQQQSAGLSRCLRQLRERIPARGTLILFSDVLEEEESLMKELRWYRARGDDLLLFHVLHAEEKTLPESGPILLVDSESGQSCPLRGADQRALYQQQIHCYIDQLRTMCRQEGIDYSPVDTGQPFFTSLKRYLHERSRVR